MNDNKNVIQPNNTLLLIGITLIFIVLLINVLILFNQKTNQDTASLMDSGIQRLYSSMSQVSKMSGELQLLFDTMGSDWNQISEHYMDKTEFNEIMEKNNKRLNEINGNLKSVSNFLYAFTELNKYFNINKVPSKFELLNVYGVENSETLEIGVDFCIMVPDDLMLASKLEYFTSKVSKFKFRNNLELKGIEKQNGKKIAHIEFVENKNARYKWDQSFQGSTGGAVTTKILIKIFLQPDYSGKWIDGVQFYYDGKPFVDKDHTNLFGVHFRDKKNAKF